MSNKKNDTENVKVDEININETKEEKENETTKAMQAQIDSMQQAIIQLQSNQTLEQSDFKKSQKPKLKITTFLAKEQKPKITIV